MRTFVCCLFNTVLLSWMITAIQNEDLARFSRRALPFRPPKVPEPNPNDLPVPYNPPVPHSPPKTPSPAPKIDGTPGSEQSSVNGNSEGTAPASNNLCYHDEEGCHEMLEKAAELIKEIVENAVDAGGSSGTTTTSRPPNPTTSASSTSVKATDGPMLNANMSSWMDLRSYSAQFTTEEFSMLKNSPVCFFAHMEALYEAYANYSSSISSQSATRTATSSSKITDAPVRRGDPLDCLSDPSAATCTEAQSSESSGSAASALYLSYLPSQISLVYRSTPTSLQVTATSTTSCSRLGNMTSFETTYALFGYRAGFEPTSTSTSVRAPSSSVADGTEVTGTGLRRRSSLSMTIGIMLALLWCMS